MTKRKLKQLKKKYSWAEHEIDLEEWHEEWVDKKITEEVYKERTLSITEEKTILLIEYIRVLEKALEKEIDRVKYLRKEIQEYDDGDDEE